MQSEPPKPKGGRLRVPDRAALAGIIFVLRSGLPWEMLPQEMGCGNGVTCISNLRAIAPPIVASLGMAAVTLGASLLRRERQLPSTPL